MKKYVWTIFFVVIIFNFWGCSNRQERIQPEKNKKEELVLWSYFETDAQQEGLDALIQAFNLSQQQYLARWEYVPMTGFNKRLSRAYTEHDLPDLVVIDNPDMATYIRLGMFEDITPYVSSWNLEEEYYASILETVTYEDKYYGIPMNCNNVALIYNVEMLNEKGITPPTTWEELREAAKILTTKERSGFLMCGIEGEQGVFQMLPWILSAGESVDNIGGEKTKEAFSFIYELIEDGSMSRDYINLSQTDVARKFAAGEVAMIENGPWVFPSIEESSVSYGVVPLPMKEKNSAVVGGENIGILKGKNTGGAVTFLKFCMEGSSLTKFCETAGVLPAKIIEARRLVEKNPKMQVFEQQMNNAVPRSSIPSWASISPAISSATFQMVSEEKTPEEAAAGIYQK